MDATMLKSWGYKCRGLGMDAPLQITEEPVFGVVPGENFENLY